MAISQVAKGVYVISPNQVKKYKDSAAGEYTSVFTKERANQWEMAQKQSLLELELGSKQYAEEMKGYRDRLDALDARRKELEGLKVRVAEGRLSATDAAAISALREAGDRQAEQARRDEAVAATGVVTTGTTTTGGGGRRGGTGADAISDEAQKEIDLSKAQVAPTDAVGLVGNVETKIGAGRIGAGKPAEADAARYRVVNESVDATTATIMSGNPGMPYEDARDAARIKVVGSLRAGGQAGAASAFERIDAAIAAEAGTGAPTVTTRETEYYKKYPGLAKNISDAPTVTPPAVESDAALQARIDQQIADVGTERAGLDRPSMAGFDYITRARDIAAGRFGPVRASPSYGQRNAIEALLRADKPMRDTIIESFSKSGVPIPGGVPGLTAPGVTAPSAATAPAAPVVAPTTASAWESVGVVRPDTGNPDADAASYQAAKVAWSKSQAAARATPAFTMPPREEVAIAKGKSAETIMADAVSAGAAARTPGLTPGGQSALQRLADTKFAEAKRMMDAESRIGIETAMEDRPFEIPFEERGGELVPFFRKPGGRADQRALDEYIARERDAAGRAAPPMGTYPSAAADIRPEAADLMTEDEKQQFRDKLRAATFRPRFTGEFVPEAEAFEPDLAVPVTARTSALRAPSAPPRIGIEDMLSQRSVGGGGGGGGGAYGGGGGTIAESTGTVRVPSGAVPPSAGVSIGRYSPGSVPPIAEAAPSPSTEGVAPRSAAAAPEGTFDRPSRPLLANMRAGMAIKEGTESMEASGAAAKTMADIKAAGTIESFRGPKTGPRQTKEGYLINRLEGAYLLAKKADKLSRLSASGPGKVAYDLYRANKSKGIPFSRTYEEITLTFAGDGPAMEKAHETALALDIKDRDTAPGGK
jgi:hypothetical protein